MIISIVWGKSEGGTVVSAFDGALMRAGIHNLNLVSVSSVIPEDAEVREVGSYKSRHKIGDILYVAISSISSSKQNTQISAGLGWVQTKQGGLFFESKGEFSPEDCADEITIGLREMMSTRSWDGSINMKIITHKVKRLANLTVAAIYDFKRP